MRPARAAGGKPSPRCAPASAAGTGRSGVPGAGGGFVILGGPVGDGQETLHLVAAADRSEVVARWGRDPWAAGLLEVGTIEPWRLWLDGRVRR
jgi:hypothetical protein